MDSPDNSEIAGDGAAMEKGGGSQRLALAALFFGAATLGLSPILVRLSELGPTASAFHRVFLALPLLWLWLSLDNRRADSAPARPEPKRRDYGMMALAGFFFAGDLAFWHWSLQYTAVANATLLATMAPVWVTLGSFLFFGERFSLTFLFGVAVAVFGAAVLMGGSVQFGFERVLGDLMGLVTGIFFGAYLLTVGRLRAHFSAGAIMFFSTLATAVLLVPVTLLSGEAWLAVTLTGWLVLLGLAWVIHVGGQGAVAYALAHLPAAFSALAMLLEALAAVLLAWIILDEALDGWQILGAGIVIGGIVMARRGSK